MAGLARHYGSVRTSDPIGRTATSDRTDGRCDRPGLAHSDGPCRTARPLMERDYFFRFFPAPTTIAVFLWALAALTLMNLPLIALRPMPGAVAPLDLDAAFFTAVFFFLVAMGMRRDPAEGIGDRVMKVGEWPGCELTPLSSFSGNSATPSGRPARAHDRLRLKRARISR